MARVLRSMVLILAIAVLVAPFVHAGGDSPLTKAARADDFATVRKLVESKTDVNATAGDGSTPLLWAVHNLNIEMVRVLIAAGAKPDVVNNFGVTPLLAASRVGDAAIMELLLKAGADPKRTHPEGETTLMAAAKTGHIAAMKLLIDRGVDVNAADSYQSQTALMWAAAEGNTEAVEYLLKAGANADLKAHVNTLAGGGRGGNSDHPTGGFTALMFAARHGHDDTLRALAKGGADLNLRNADNATAMIIAIYNYRFDTGALLADLGADANDGSLLIAVEMRQSVTDQFAFDGSRLRPNHANKLSNVDLIGHLMKKGADPLKPYSGKFHSWSMPNSETVSGTPFFNSVGYADAEALRVMLENGADPNAMPPAAPAGGGRGGPGGPGGAAPRGGARGGGGASQPAAIGVMSGGKGVGKTGGPGYVGNTTSFREPGSRKPVDALIALVKGGANPNTKGTDGQTLLHTAVAQNNLELIKALASAKVDFFQTNNDGLTALDVAEGKAPAGGRGGAGARGAGPGGPGGRGAAPGARGAAPPAVGGPRGARGDAAPAPEGASRQDVVKLMREVMGLPPAAPGAVPAQPAAEKAADANGGNQ